MKQKTDNPLVSMPVLAMRGMVLFPDMVLHFDVGRERSILALNEAMASDRMIFLTSQKEIKDDTPELEEINTVGVVAEIKQIIKSKGFLRVLVEGKYRANLVSMEQMDPHMEGFIEEYPTRATSGTSKDMMSALVRTLQDQFQEHSLHNPRMTREILFDALSSDDPLYLTDYIASNMPISYTIKQDILEESSIPKRIRELIKIIEEENRILSLEQEIHDKVKSQIDTNQREFYLREQMRAIQDELGVSSSEDDEIAEYLEKIEQLDLTDEIKEKLEKEVDRLDKMPPNSHEASVIRNWLDVCLDLPWNIYTEDSIDIKEAGKYLNRDHYGMEKVKERILEMLSVLKLAPDQKGQIICLVGPPGVGKTSIARSVAEAMNREYTRMSLGGVRDESDIRGHRKTYIGAMPGRIMTAIEQAGSSNPLLLLDEVDKLGSDFRGDPSAALLEVLDSEQNFAFRDHYIELPFDLSQVLFIATANDISTIPRPLLDRMEVITLGSYTREEKFQIAKRHLIPKQLERHGLTATQAKFTQTGIYSLIDYYTRESGVRALEREIASVLRKVAKQIVSDEIKTVSLTGKRVEEYLGSHKFKQNDTITTDEVGVVNGLAWTAVGGEILQIEVAVLKGTGKTVLTGSLGDVMKESAQAAISFVRSKVGEYSIDPNFYKDKDIHIHVPEGAVPKDGPSAGITIVTAVTSALTNIPVYGHVAMTGESSLRGRVLPIGGLREKAMAAYRNGITTVIIPTNNLPDLEEVDDIVKENIKFIPVDTVQQVLDIALTKKPKKSDTKGIVSSNEDDSDIVPAIM